jgi:hypothetical protein
MPPRSASAAERAGRAASLPERRDRARVSRGCAGRCQALPATGPGGGGSIIESGGWREPFADFPFEPLRDEAFEHESVQDRGSVVSETLSVSIYASLPEEERTELARELRTALPDVVYRTPYRSEVTWTRLR